MHPDIGSIQQPALYQRMAKDIKLNRTGVYVLAAIGTLVMIFLLYHRIRPVESIKISKLLSASIVLAERGGKRIVEIRKMGDQEIGQLSKGLTKEGKNEYVTLGDKESHEIIVSGLKSLWPNLPLQSEENDRAMVEVKPIPQELDVEIQELLDKGDRDIPLDDVTVWIDPLDATHEYTEGQTDPSLLRYVTVMVCIAVKGIPIAGVIHQPYQRNEVTKSEGVTKWAWVDHGVSESLVADTDPPSKESTVVRVISSRSHSGDVKEVAEKAVKDTPKTLDHIVAAGSGHKVLQVVENHADLYLHTTAIKKWDICAGNAVLNAVGGTMMTRRGQKIDYSFEGSEVNTDGLIVVLSEPKYADIITKLQLH